MTELAPDDPRHGTRNGYNNLDCRCPKCRAAQSAAMREWKHRTGQQRPWDVYLAVRRAQPPPPHGTESRYRNRGCRCDECRSASAAARRRRRAAA